MSNSTRNKIIEATIELVNERGYKGATTREIAKRAGVNEVTLFRHFGSKKGIVEAVIKEYEFVDLIENTFDEKIIWDLEKDIQMLAKEYQSLLEKKKTVLLLSLKEANNFPELNELTKYIPQKYIEIVEEYFKEMVERGIIKEADPSIIATNFAFINFGYFLLKTRLNQDEELTIDAFIERNIAFFIQSLK